MTDRIDALLDAYLDTGELPADATDEERRDVLAMARAAGLALSARPKIEHEARVTMPTARARFERFVGTQQPSPSAAHRPAGGPRRAWWSRLGTMPRGFAVAGLAAAIGVIAVVALVAIQNFSSTTESAVAAVLTPGDYTQVEGTVSAIAGEGADRVATVDSLLGEVRVSVPPGASLVGADGSPADASALRPGVALLIGGLVQQDRSIVAQTVALAGDDREPIRPATSQELRARPPDVVQGTVRLVSVGEGEALGMLVIVSADGRYAVPISGRTAARMLAADSAVIGATVTATRENGGLLYTVRIDAAADGPDSADFVRVTGVLRNRAANVLSVQTERGIVLVVIRAETRILLGESGLTVAGVARGETAIGHTISVQGSVVPGTRRIVADVLVVGPAAQP